MKILFYLFVLTFCGITQGATYLTYCHTQGDPQVGGEAQPYGYKSSSQGPGDRAFQKLIALCSQRIEYKGKYRRPIILHYGKDNCTICSEFAKMVNDNVRGLPPYFAFG